MLLLDKITQQVRASQPLGLCGAVPCAHLRCDAHDSGVAHVLFWCADDGGVLHAAVLGGLTFVPRMLGLFFWLGGVLSHAVAL